MGFLNDMLAARGRFLMEREAQLGVKHTPYIIGDKGAYLSPMDRTVVDGRTAHKEHMRKHGVIEAGDMKPGEMARSDEPAGIRQDIQRAISEVSSR